MARLTCEVDRQHTANETRVSHPNPRTLLLVHEAGASGASARHLGSVVGRARESDLPRSSRRCTASASMVIATDALCVSMTRTRSSAAATALW